MLENLLRSCSIPSTKLLQFGVPSTIPLVHHGFAKVIEAHIAVRAEQSHLAAVVGVVKALVMDVILVKVSINRPEAISSRSMPSE